MSGKGTIGMIALWCASQAYAIDRTTTVGEVPTPYNLNQAVELAGGEDYQLKGRIFYSHGAYFYLVNLNEHRWLASSKRKSRPYYEIVVHPGLDLKLSTYEQRPIIIKAKAEEVLRVDEAGVVHPDIRLVVLTVPEVPSRKKGSKGIE